MQADSTLTSNCISVVVPAFNCSGTIGQSLRSIADQTAVGCIREIIVVDDGSQDNTAQVVERFFSNHPELVCKIVRKENGGASSARNEGMKRATGEYIAFLDSDDVWLPSKIERQMQILEANPEIALLGAACSDKPLKLGFRTVTGLYRATAKDICLRNFPVTPSVIIRRSVCDEVGYFDETQKYGEDINYFQKIGSRFNYYYLSERLVEINLGKSFEWETGLSSNLLEMHHGTLRNLDDMQYRGDISNTFRRAMYVFYWLKYLRRVIIRQIRAFKKRRGGY